MIRLQAWGGGHEVRWLIDNVRGYLARQLVMARGECDAARPCELFIGAVNSEERS